MIEALMYFLIIVAPFAAVLVIGEILVWLFRLIDRIINGKNAAYFRAVHRRQNRYY